MISNNLKYYRARLNKTQEEIASELRISTKAYQAYEEGRCEPPIRTLIKLKKVFGLKSIDQLINPDHENDTEKLRATLFRKYLEASEKNKKIVDLVLNIASGD